MSDDTGWLIMALALGPSEATGEWSMGQLKRAWSLYGGRLMADRRTPGTRPWGWWAFEAREGRPEGEQAEALRLSELGELSPGEIAEVLERAQDEIQYAEDAAPRISAEDVIAQARRGDSVRPECVEAQ
jgi:hypothetical protein